MRKPSVSVVAFKWRLAVGPELPIPTLLPETNKEESAPPNTTLVPETELEPSFKIAGTQDEPDKV